MKKLICLIIPLLVVVVSCKKTSVLRNVPTCVKEMIEKNDSNQDWIYKAVEEHEFQQQIVYAFVPDNEVVADASIMVVTSDCTTLCNVGGLSGDPNNNCNGTNFIEKAVLKRVIWTK